MTRLPSTTPALAQPAPDSRRWIGPVLLAGVLMALMAVGAQRLWGEPMQDPAGAVAWQRQLHFEDLPNGDIGVLDLKGQQVLRIAGEEGFMRGALRVLARERHRRGLGPAQPFVLTAHAGGRLILSDPATGVRIALESFGPAQVATFARLQPTDQ